MPNIPKPSNQDELMQQNQKSISLLPPTQPNISQAIDRVQKKRVRRGTKIRLLILLILLIIAGCIAAFFFLFPSSRSVSPSTAPNPNSENGVNATNAAIPEPSTVLDEPIRDSDGDGLLDSEESQYGTNPELLDTDSDGLNDRQEVRVYQTEPTVPDTDGDGFLDGEEVRNFFNPKGDGKLLEESELIKEIDIVE